MDIMLLGETITEDVGSASYEGFWMPAGGNDGVGAIEIFMHSGSGDFQVRMETKMSDEADTGAGVIGSATITATGITKFDVASAQDLVRYVVIRTGEGTAYTHFQLSQPLWAPN